MGSLLFIVACVVNDDELTVRIACVVSDDELIVCNYQPYFEIQFVNNVGIVKMLS